MSVKKIMVFAALAALFIIFIIFDGQQFLKLEVFKNLYQQQPGFTLWVYFVIYVVVTTLSLPAGATLLTLGAGAIFGVWTGVLLVSFASTIGATFAFLMSRFLLREWVQKKYSQQLLSVNRGIEKDGGFYLFTLRLIPAIPFFAINLLLGLTPIRVRTYYLVSQLGMLPATFVYVNAGAELGAIEELSPAGILTPGLFFAFVLLGLLPLLVRFIVERINSLKVYRPFQKPTNFDTNMVVIGAGSAGLVSAYIAAAVKAKVTLVEKHKMGGDCLNTGCVPSKALIRAAKSVSEIQHASELGVQAVDPKVDFGKVMARVHEVVRSIEPHDSVERYTDLGVDCLQGDAKILSPWQVQVGDNVINTRNIVIATGARPFVPPIPGLDDIDYLTSDNLWDLTELPERLLVMGGGPIGCELAQAFNRLGSSVTLVDMMPRILPREDEDVSAFVQDKLVEEGVAVLVGHKSVGFEFRDDGAQKEGIALLESSSGKDEVAFDKVLVAVGRKANVEGCGLEELGIEVTPQGTVAVDDYLRTRFPNIVACGDVAGPYQFTHTASHQAWYAAVNSLFGGLKKFRVDYSVIPWVTFTDPEVAHVGLSEVEANEQGIDYEITRYDLSDLDRAIADNSASGFVKVLTATGKDRILGVTIVGARAGDMLTEFVIAMKHNLGLNKILGTIHPYPTLSEANKFTAGEWKRAHAPEKLLKWVEKYHTVLRR